MRLRQLVTNLVGNAIKFTERGEIVVTVEQLQMEDCKLQIANQPNNLQSAFCNLQFSIKDTGIGIPADKLGLIFDPFTQAGGSTTRRYGGTGLGLTICRHLVELMGGRIWVESEVGRGSTFHFTAQFGQVAAVPEDPVELSLLAGQPALVVDDHPTTRRILAALLGELGLRATSVDGATAALAERARAEAAGAPYALFLVDAALPEVGDLTRRLSAGTAPGVVILLQSSSEPSVERGGALCTLHKPLSRSALVKGLRRCLGEADEAAPEELARAERRLRVLLVDDNQFNQKVGLAKLEMMGHDAVVAGSGEEALALLAEQSFDLVLMDVQMPGMDGFETTEAIRARDQESGRHTPIIAMTAHAGTGERERCLERGMDGYVSKPIRDRDLLEAMAEVVPATAGTAPLAPAPAETLDEETTLARVGGNLGLLRELVTAFHSDCGSLMPELQRAIRAGDGAGVSRAAHTLKGMVSFFGAAVATEATRRLEQLGQEGQLAGAEAAFTTLTEEIERIQEALVALSDRAA